MGKLVRKQDWRPSRPATCRQCGSQVGWYEVAVFDPDEPWLVFHESCLQEIVLERIVALYDEIRTLARTDHRARGNARQELDRLREEIGLVTELLDGKRIDISGPFRPGIRRE